MSLLRRSWTLIIYCSCCRSRRVLWVMIGVERDVIHDKDGHQRIRMDIKDSDAGTCCGNGSVMWWGRPEWEGGSYSCSVRVVAVQSSYVLIVRFDGLLLSRFLGRTVHNNTIQPNTSSCCCCYCYCYSCGRFDVIVMMMMIFLLNCKLRTIKSLPRWNSTQKSNTLYVLLLLLYMLLPSRLAFCCYCYCYRY